MDDRTICLDMVETLPDTSKPRVAEWVDRRKDDGRFDWKELILHLKENFADRKAWQVALEYINQMEQGESQSLADFLLDFE